MQPTSERLSAGQRWTLAVSCLGVALVIASMAALYMALPEIALGTGATQQQLTWIVDAYTLALACLVLPAGSIGDRYGRRAVLVFGLAIFAIATVLPLFLTAPGWLIASRAVAGVGAALVMPSTLSLMTSSFPAKRRGSAVGVWAGIAGAGGVIGLLGSGVLLEHWTWESIFIGLSATGAALALCSLKLPESVDETRKPLDFSGALAVAVSVGAIVVAVIEAPTRGWTDPMTLGLITVGILAAAAFVRIELLVEHPLLDMRLFTDRGFGSGTASVTIQFLATFGFFMLVVQFMQLIYGYSPMGSAIALAPMALPIICISPFAPWIAERFGLRLPTFIGLTVIGCGLLYVSQLSADSGYTDLLLPMLLMSVGLGLCTAPATAAIIAGTPVEKHGVAAAVNDASREIGAAIGIAISGSVLAAGYSEQIAGILPRLPEAARGPVGDSLAAALEVAELSGPAGQPLADFAKEAFTAGARESSLALGILAIVAAVVIGIWAPGRRTTIPAVQSEANDEHEQRQAEREVASA